MGADVEDSASSGASPSVTETPSWGTPSWGTPSWGTPSWAAALAAVSARKPPSALRRRAVHRVKQPLIHARRAMEPHRVIDARDHRAFADPAHAVGTQGGRDQVVVRRVRQHAGVQQAVIGHSIDSPKPDRLPRLGYARLERIPRRHRAEIDGGRPAKRFADALGNRGARFRQPLLAKVGAGAERFRRWDLRHRLLVLEARLHYLEGSDHREDRAAVLDGLHAPGAEAGGVADA